MREIFVAAEIYVIYGCSEISLRGCTWRVDDKPSIDKTYVGKPFSNVRLALLDDDGNRVPVGAVGNVCFAGGGVVDSYLNRPELTDRLFFERDGQRYYSTGDRGRLNTAGDLELLGRRDFQVQIRGMRVELGEIEYHLRQAEGVREGVVASRRRWDGARRGRRDRASPAHVLQTARLHGADVLRRARGAAAEREHEGRQAGTSRPGAVVSWPGAAFDADGTDAGTDLA
jgi:acyl-coenzyme A synthetase/AMP-(fatty) acid ligase